jgi:hypothetical protein
MFDIRVMFYIKTWRGVLLSMEFVTILDSVLYVNECRSCLLNGSLIISVWGRDMVANLRDSDQLYAISLNFFGKH